MEVDDTLLMRLDDILRQQDAVCDVAAHLAGHVIALGAVHDRVLVGVLLLGLLVVALDQGENLVVRCVGLADERARIAIGDILFRDFIRAVGHDLILDHVLDLLHRRRTSQLHAGHLHRIRDAMDLCRGHAHVLGHDVVRFGNSRDDLCNVKYGLGTVSLDDLHFSVSPALLYFRMQPFRLHNICQLCYPTTTSSGCQR